MDKEMHTCDMQEKKNSVSVYDGGLLRTPILGNGVMSGVLP